MTNFFSTIQHPCSNESIIQYPPWTGLQSCPWKKNRMTLPANPPYGRLCSSIPFGGNTKASCSMSRDCQSTHKRSTLFHCCFCNNTVCQLCNVLYPSHTTLTPPWRTAPPPPQQSFLIFFSWFLFLLLHIVISPNRRS